MAVYGLPVPPTAVDYVLQPYMPTIDSARVLRRLVNMQLARREADRYYLHQVDREYALGRVPEGAAGDRDTQPTPFSRYALRDRAADYYGLIRPPREDWKTVDDLETQLAEFELLYQGGVYDSAAGVLLDIDPEYLQR